MDFTIPEELQALQALARRFIKGHLAPLEREVEEKDDFPDHLRRPLRKRAVGLGLWSYHAPAEYGGGGVGALGLVLVCEELGEVSIAVGQQGGVIGVGRESFLFDGNDQQKEKYLIPFLKGDREFFVALTEPGAGSDTRNLQTRAVRRGSDYIINGTKTFITMAQRADFGLVWAATDPAKPNRGITCFLLDQGTRGFSVARRLPMFGRRGLDTCELTFDDCVVPQENVLGADGRGLRAAMRGLVDDRLAITGCCIGAAQRAYAMAASYAQGRVTFGKPLAQRQLIQSMLMDTNLDLFAARMMAYNAAWGHDQGADAGVKIALAKIFAAEMANRAVDRAMQIHGAYGYCKDLPLEMIYRDVRGARIGGGAAETLRCWAASQVLGVPFE